MEQRFYDQRFCFHSDAHGWVTSFCQQFHAIPLIHSWWQLKGKSMEEEEC